MNQVVSISGNHSSDSRPPRHARYITVCSGRDGVGKSSIAVNTAVALARMGNRVLLIDADGGVASAAALLGLAPTRTLDDCLAGSCRLSDALIRGPASIQLLCGARRLGDLTASAARRPLLGDLEELEIRFDYILIDTIAGDDPALAAAIKVADNLALVVTPDPGSLSDTFAMLNQLAHGRRGFHLHVVINQSPTAAVANDTYQRFSTTISRYLGIDVACAGTVHRDEAVRNAFALQYPVALYPSNDPSCQTFFKLARNLLDQFEPCEPEQGLRALVASAVTTDGSADHAPSARSPFRATPVEPEPAPDSPGPLPAQALPAISVSPDVTLIMSERRQFLRCAELAAALARQGELTVEEFDAVTGALSAVAREHFPTSCWLREPHPLTGAAHLPDGEEPEEADLDRFQQSLLGTLRENRGSGKPLEQLLTEFVATARSGSQA